MRESIYIFEQGEYLPKRIADELADALQRVLDESSEQPNPATVAALDLLLKYQSETA